MAKSSAPKRIVVSINVLIQILLAGAIIVFANMAFNKWHPKKTDLSKNDYYKLSDKTIKLLNSLTSPVDVIVFFQPMSDDPVVVKVFDDIQSLLKEYHSVSSNVNVRYIDPDRDPVGTQKLADEYNVQEANVVVFSYKKGENEKRSKFVKVVDLVEFDNSRSPMGESNRIKSFKGEQQFTSAIQNVVESKVMKVCFIQGHGEGDPEEQDPRKGFSDISSYIKRDNLVVEKLNILQKQGIPKDCDVLVACAPTRPYGEEELKAIREYLGQNGRMLVLLDGLKPDTGLESILAEYDVKVGNDVVLIKIQDRLGGEALVTTAPGVKYANHPITESFRKNVVATLFPAARSIQRMGAPNSKQKVTTLVETVDTAWGETNMADLQKEKAAFDDKDLKGPVPIAAAVEPNAAGDMEREGMRMVVIGSSGFVRNGNLKGGNVDFFMNSLNWLVKRQQLIGIAAKTPEEFALSLDVFQKRGVFFVEVILIPLAVAIVGCTVWFLRRR